MLEKLSSLDKLFVKQVFELAEIFGFETRNKYRISDDSGQVLGFAAEQQKSFWGMLLRQFIGHWRTFELHFFDNNRKEVMVAQHPFRWYFQRLDVFDATGAKLGAVEKRFSILSKKFHVENAQGEVTLEVSSPIWRIWTFNFLARGQERARISKKWSGVGYEMFTDRDNFMVEYLDKDLTQTERAVLLAASVYVDLVFFEKKASS